MAPPHYFAMKNCSLSPYINRFLSADAVVPSMYNPQAFNHYSYVGNNPIRYIDPTGHKPCDGDGTGGCVISSEPFTRGQVVSRLRHYGVKFAGNWSAQDALAVFAGVDAVAQKLIRAAGGGSAEQAFRQIFHEYTFTMDSDHIGQNGSGGTYFCERFSGSGTKCYGNAAGNVTGRLIAHEIAHVFNATIANNGFTTPYTDLGREGIQAEVDGEAILIAGNHGGLYQRTQLGYNGSGSQEDRYASAGEDFADTFMNWTFGTFSADVYGSARSNWIQSHILTWIRHASASVP